MSEQIKLRKCPFCSSNAELVTDREGMSLVRCLNMGCKVSTRVCGGKEIAISKWNTRVKEIE